jgi:cytochrome c5
MKTTLIAVIAGVGILAAGSAVAAEHKTPVAPKDYLAMKNPLKNTKDVVETGAKIYEKKCKKCHGDKGDGKGSASDKLELKPVSFSTPGFLKGRAD